MSDSSSALLHLGATVSHVDDAVQKSLKGVPNL